MANFIYKTRGNSSPQGKPKVYFAARPCDFYLFEAIADEILAYGDSENDRELLSWVGTAVTIYGAKHEIFSITKYHTQNVAESVIRFLRDEDAAQNRRSGTHGKI